MLDRTYVVEEHESQFIAMVQYREQETPF